MRAKKCSWCRATVGTCWWIPSQEPSLAPQARGSRPSPRAELVAPCSGWRAAEKFHQMSTAALRSLCYGYEKVRIKQLLAWSHAVKFVYEVNFNKKQTVSVVYKQTQAVKTRECFVNTSTGARWGPGGKLPAVCSWLSHACRIWPVPAARWNQSQGFAQGGHSGEMHLHLLVKVVPGGPSLYHPVTSIQQNGRNDEKGKSIT